MYPITMVAGATAALDGTLSRSAKKCCPTPYKEAFGTEGEARSVIRHMKQRAKRKKCKYHAVEPYKCRCGAVHLTSISRH